MTDTTEDIKRKKALERIRVALARTTANGCTEAEAKAAADLVDRLVAEYEIDLTETTVGEQEIVRLDIALNMHVVRGAAGAIAQFCDCKCWYDTTNGAQNLCFLGLEIDTEIAEYLLLMFQRAIDRETMQFLMFEADALDAGPAASHQMGESFGVGMAVRLGQRLADLKSKRDFAQRSKGFDLVLAKAPLIEEGWQSLGINLGKSDRFAKSARHQGAYDAGRSAADRVAINQGVTGRAANNGRIK